MESLMTVTTCLVFLSDTILFSYAPQRIGDTSHVEALRSTMDLESSRACDGQFEEDYLPVQAVGKGAFGFVWKAIRRCDGQEVRGLLIHREVKLTVQELKKE